LFAIACLFDQLSDKRLTAPKDHASPAVAQVFPLSTRLPAGLVVRLNGSTSVKAMDRQLKAGFEAAFPGTTVNIATEFSR
jgi:ABC-type phosphate transport system substrate-binding protein